LSARQDFEDQAMDFESTLKEYEANMQEIEEKYTMQKRSCAEKLRTAKNELSAVNSNIERILAEINVEVTNKYIALAIDELYPYINSFDIAAKTPHYCGDGGLTLLTDELQGLYDKGKTLKELISTLDGEMKELEREYSVNKNKLIGPIQVQYRQLTENVMVDFNIRNQMPQKAYALPHEVLIGDSIKRVNNALALIDGEILRYPLFFDVKNGKGIVLQYARSVSDDTISRIITALAIKLLESFPFGALKVGIINFVSHPCINAFCEGISKTDISYGDVIIDKRGIDQLFNSVTQACTRINSKLLQNNSSDIYDLYEKGINTEQFQLIIVKGALRNIDESNLRTLYSWMESYSHCGIKFLLADCFDEETLKNKSFEYNELVEKIKQCSVFSIEKSGITLGGNTSIELLALSKSNNDRDVFAYCSHYKAYGDEGKKRYVSYEQIGFGTDKKRSNDSIYIPIAYNAPNIWNIEFHCTSKSPLANLIVGVPGTGKSRLIDAMILNGAIKYSPNELIFHLLDFKDGLSSDAYLSECAIPHVKVVSRENKAEEADIILSSILLEKEERAAEFKKHRVSSIAGYNQIPGNSMPRLIIVIDECQHIFDNDILTQKCEQIVREGRATGIHLVLATQTVTQQMMRTIKFVDGRYCFELASQADAEQLLDKEFTKRLEEISKSSHKAFVTDFSSGNREIVKIEPAFDGDEDESRTKRAEYARRIRERWSKFPIDVFDVGNQDPYTFSDLDIAKIRNTSLLNFYIGINYQNRSDIILQLERESQSAVFLVSSISNLYENVLSSIIIQGHRQKATMYVVNAMGEKNVGQVLNCLPSQLGFEIGDERNYIDILSKVYAEYLKRASAPNDAYEPVMFIVNGLQNILDFKNNIRRKVESTSSNIVDEDSLRHLSFNERRAARANATLESLMVAGKETFFELLSNSYRVGIYICCSADSVSMTNSSGQLFSSGDRNIIRQCKYKILDANAGEDVRNIMENSFKEKMLLRMNENVCFMSERQKNYYKIKYVQFDFATSDVNNLINTEGETDEN
jgi:hypothetical protein